MKYEIVPHPNYPKTLLAFRVTTRDGSVYMRPSEWRLGHGKPNNNTVKYCWHHSRDTFQLVELSQP
jgi:hypothetical protein